MTVEEAIAMLKKDLALDKAIYENGFTPHDEISNEIDNLDYSLSRHYIMPTLKEFVAELLQDLDRKYKFTIEKDENGEIIVTDNYNSDEEFEDLIGDPETQELERKYAAGEWITLTKDNLHYATDSHLRVIVEGEVIDSRTSKTVFLKTLTEIGLERVAEVGIMRVGYNLVDDRERLDGGKKWQEKIDDKWVYTNINNQTKAAYLLEIAEYYGLDLQVEARKLKIDD